MALCDIDVVVMGIGLAAVIGGFAAERGSGGSSGSKFLAKVANRGFGDFISGFRGLGDIRGGGVRVRTGSGDFGRWDSADTFIEAAVADLLLAGLFIVCGDTAFCSKRPIRDVVGGIGVVSKA